MQKLAGIVCDGCRKFVPYCNEYVTIKGKKRELHYCSEECRNIYHALVTHPSDTRDSGNG